MTKSKVTAVPRYAQLRAVSRSEGTPVTPLTYLAELAGSSWRHPGELAAAAFCAAGTGILALWLRSLQDVQRGPDILAFVLLPAAAFLLFQAAVAAWRLHRRQQSALATTRSLLDLNAGDRIDLERRLRTRYLRREARTEEIHAARLERLGTGSTS